MRSAFESYIPLVVEMRDLLVISRLYLEVTDRSYCYSIWILPNPGTSVISQCSIIFRL